jgi:predicted glycoside hydrolase/deacetylase ChbG (UPF0249 family)
MTRPSGTPVALCADDYGFAPGVDEGILALASAGRLSALSCMTLLPRWKAAAGHLAPLFGRVDIGLHFTLTDLAPLGPMPRLAPAGDLPPLRRLLAQAYAGGIDAGEIAAEFARQYDAFEAALGRPPDFVDGHHHVHQLPGIRDAVAAALAGRPAPFWVRNTATPAGLALRRGVDVPRALGLSVLGGMARRRWRQAGVSTNLDFAGVRSFAERAPYRDLLRRYLAGARPGLLVMCHPGRVDAELAGRDSVTAPREAELAYLGGDAFPEDLVAAGCRLERLSAWVARRTSSAGG